MTPPPPPPNSDNIFPVYQVQMLAELEEVVEYKLAPDRRATIREMWWKRLQVTCGSWH